MMSVSFDELMHKAREVALAAGKVAGDMVGEVVDTSKLKLAEARLCSEIREATERLGSIVYEAARTGRDSLKLQQMLIGELDSLYASLDELHKKANPTRGDLVCPQCGEKNPASGIFCTQCGAQLTKEDSSEYAVDTEIDDLEEAAEAATQAAAEVAEATFEVAEDVAQIEEEPKAE